ncbi:hypothetical protein Clacol_006972 [Clathrus columnatus]|uniref:DUF6533 domain-containing protein n=1 Tax=Clathrus columnatus TaxID=1419009 RepID=A0AAV5AHY9_9AGAM|nr:hypothetical protein Clacol_006972 [Clathrus columnatus]
MTFGAVTILTYASFLHFSDEVKYIWKAKFTIPTYLYLFSKYPAFLFFFLAIYLNLVQETLRYFPITSYSIFENLTILQSRECSDVVFSGHAIAILPLVGTQDQATVTNDIHNIALTLSDTFALIAVIRHVWGLWKLKQTLGLRNNKDLTTLLLHQGIFRFLYAFEFVVYFNGTDLASSIVFLMTTTEIPLITVSYGKLSSLLLCEFTLDLRRRNAQESVPNQSALDLPTLSFHENPTQSIRSALGQLHESIVNEMGERNEPSLRMPDQDDLQDPDEPHNANLGTTTDQSLTND